MRRRLILFVLAVVAVTALSAGGPSGRLAILTHQPSDPSPQRVEASLALGKAALSLLITWTSRSR